MEIKRSVFLCIFHMFFVASLNDGQDWFSWSLTSFTLFCWLIIRIGGINKGKSLGELKNEVVHEKRGIREDNEEEWKDERRKKT